LKSVSPVSFKLYDFDGDGCIDKVELFTMLRAAMLESADLQLTERQMNEIVEQTFSMVSVDNSRITFGMATTSFHSLGPSSTQGL